MDHLFLDTAGALRRALDETLLERAGGDDRLLYDLLSGDMVWETSVSLPGDADPPPVSADISLDWQTWSQLAWRNVTLGEGIEDPPEIGIEVVFRAQGLAARPALAMVLAVMPELGPDVGGEPMTRAAPVIEEAYDDEAEPPEVAVEVAYEGTYRLPLPGPAVEAAGTDDSSLFPGWATPRTAASDAMRRRLDAVRQMSSSTETMLSALGAWVASVLVQMADLDLEYLPPTQPEG